MSCPCRSTCRLCKQKREDERKRLTKPSAYSLWETKLSPGSKSDLGPAYHGNRIETFVRN